MKLTVFGASGGTGGQVLAQALDAGHHVTAVARASSTLAVTEHPRLTVVRADVFDAEAIAPAVAGADAVVTALGSRQVSAPTEVCARGTRAILAAMHATGTRRLVAVSASGAFSDSGDGPLTRYAVKPVLRRVLRHSFADMRAMERAIRDSAVDWTVVRPPMLTNGPLTRRYRTALNRNVRGGIRLSRADLAHCVLHQVGEPTAVRAVVCVGY
ncbi:NAD(P)-dependent oxidoreductase [Goodfellowiella coeruleoviolacea]|uniref:NADH-flavin reductase n=1 Tax=Goodfellowiella coeruleoviolacea TaxID=334858 RepID=A0AAE3GMK1_9PSEU|nr:SDR family oxidoreductase [Goodfellowiella coeruleoviolacea]MCP2170034.1 putative NADH-flavin reductase [Goodfellowiella coeruleoviolacea]